jgi:hypothetical protein
MVVSQESSYIVFMEKQFSQTNQKRKNQMLKFNTKSLATVSVTLGLLLSSQLSHAADTYNNKKTTTVEQTTTQTTSTAPRPAARPAPRPVAKVAPVTTSSTTTVTVKNGDLRKVLDEDALKKMSDSLCTEGFKAYVGNDKKNVCQGKAEVPDLAYSCVWNESGNAAYSPTEQGPCSLDYSVHKDSIVVTKNEYTANPPLSYGTEAQCCFRAAQGPAVSSTEVSPTIVVPQVK